MSYNGSASPVVAFSLCVVEHAPEPPAPGSADADSPPRFVLVHEKQVRGWWLPGGGVDAGQTLQEAAVCLVRSVRSRRTPPAVRESSPNPNCAMNQVREAEEEAGCAIELTGVLRVEYAHDYGRLRVIWAGAWADLAGVLSSHSPHTALCNGI
jgi:8-oxo-dGTP pyrophosphatase MutT (NUDIX family)